MNSLYYKQRWEIVFLCRHTHGNQWSVSKTAKYLKVSDSMVRFWLQRFDETGTVDDVPKSGRSKVTTESQDKRMVKMVESGKAKGATEVVQKMSSKGVSVSPATVRRRLVEKGFRYGKRVNKPMLLPRHIAQRLEWAVTYRDIDWSRVIFSDESTFVPNYQLKGVWKRKGQIIVTPTTKHPTKVNMWGCFSERGFGKLVVIVGTLKSPQMVSIYENGLLPSAQKFFGADSRDWILLEDNDPKHRSKLCTRWKRENGVKVMKWPAQSPDCNPIENVWSFLKSKLSGIKFDSTLDLIVAINKVWSELPITYAQNLVKSMRQRCDLVIAQDGDWIPY